MVKGGRYRLPQRGKILNKIHSVLYWLLAILAGLGIAFLFFWLRGDFTAPTLAQPPVAAKLSYARAVNRASPAVVNIYANKRVTSKRLAHITNPAIQRILGVQGIIVPTQRLERSLGSGVLVSDNGLILTNEHVISEADDIQVLLADGREVGAKIIGTDPETDLAVLQIPLNGLPSLSLDEATDVQVGDVVLAIGNPFGLNQTVTQGIVSALQRGGTADAPLAHFIQTDAPINEGNSGGALVNTRGELIGINVATLTGVQHIQGISFAIPAALAKSVLEEILRFGHVRRGWLGIEADLNYPALRTREPGLPNGIRVARVAPDSPAAQAGIRPGDILRKVDRMKVDAHSNVLAYVATRKPGTAIQMEWLHKGQLRQATATLQQRPLPGERSGRAAGG